MSFIVKYHNSEAYFSKRRLVFMCTPVLSDGLENVINILEMIWTSF